MPLFSQLLRHGDLLFFDQPIIQHFKNRESLSTGLPEPWFHDSCDADVEIAFGNIPEPPLAAGVVEEVRQRYHQITYFQAARMCRMRQDYLLMWNFLMRAKAVGGATEGVLVQCERHFLLDAILQRICQIARDAAAQKIFVSNTPLLRAVRMPLQKMLPSVELLSDENLTRADEPEVSLVEKFEPTVSSLQSSSVIISFHEILASMRLTRNAVQVAIKDDGIRFVVSYPHDFDPAFFLLMDDYGIPTDGDLMAPSPKTATGASRFPEKSRPLLPKKSHVGRNDPCPCGSGKKYKMCHGRI